MTDSRTIFTAFTITSWLVTVIDSPVSESVSPMIEYRRMIFYFGKKNYRFAIDRYRMLYVFSKSEQSHQ